MEKINKVDICPKCGLPIPACVCEDIAKTQQKITVKTEKRRFGKLSTIISGFDNSVDTKEITKTLKAKRACGGTIKNNIIELQGNHRGNIKKILVSMGFNEDQIEE
jgi:translation initiation factor 1